MSAVAPPFYCHTCARRVAAVFSTNVVDDEDQQPTCQQCGGDFVERIEEEEEDAPMTDATAPAQLAQSAVPPQPPQADASAPFPFAFQPLPPAPTPQQQAREQEQLQQIFGPALQMMGNIFNPAMMAQMQQSINQQQQQQQQQSQSAASNADAAEEGEQLLPSLPSNPVGVGAPQMSFMQFNFGPPAAGNVGSASFSQSFAFPPPAANQQQASAANQPRPQPQQPAAQMFNPFAAFMQPPFVPPAQPQQQQPQPLQQPQAPHHHGNFFFGGNAVPLNGGDANAQMNNFMQAILAPFAGLPGVNLNFGGGGGGAFGGQQAGDFFFGDMNLLIHNLMMNDRSRYGSPPASAAAVAALPEKTLDAASLASCADAACSVCLDDFAVGDVTLQLPCAHLYHKSCLAPWLAEHNSCPACRYLLPTDDPMYEQRRAQTTQHAAQARQEQAAQAQAQAQQQAQQAQGAVPSAAAPAPSSSTSNSSADAGPSLDVD